MAEGKHLEDVARCIDKTNGSVDMGLKEGVKLSTLTSAHIDSFNNKRDEVEGVEMQGTMFTCIVSVSGAINIRAVRTTLRTSETRQQT